MTNLVKKPEHKSIMHDYFQGMADIITARPDATCWWCKAPLKDDEDKIGSSNGEMHIGCSENFNDGLNDMGGEQ